MGALPFGVWIAKAHGICIFKVGSGNPGATNVLRTIGKKAGYTVFALDALKSLIAVAIGKHYGIPYLALLGVILGHSFSCFTRFKGGKGIASLIGGLSIIIPLPLISGLIIWFITFKLFRYVSFASICLVFSLLPSCCLFYGIKEARMHAIPLAIFTLFTLYFHRFNLKNLWQGKERRF